MSGAAADVDSSIRIRTDNAPLAVRPAQTTSRSSRRRRCLQVDGSSSAS